jgi:hypothetical protein
MTEGSLRLDTMCYDLAWKSGRFQGYWATGIPKAELRVVRLQFLVATTDFDDEEMPKPAGKGPNDEEEVKEVVFPRYD